MNDQTYETNICPRAREIGARRVSSDFFRIGTPFGMVARKTHTSLIIRGIQMLTAAKFLPIGILVPLRAGALDADPVRFLVVDAVCSLFYATFYILPGFLVHDQLEQVAAFFKRVGVVSFPLFLVFLGGYFGHQFFKRRRLKDLKSDPSGPTPEENKCVTSPLEIRVETKTHSN